MSDSRPIALFDSGIGGLSILLEIKKKLPLENLIYFADQAYFPYGLKTKSEIKERSKKISSFLTGHDVKIIVIACNTASVHALSALREKIKVPIVGVVPAVKPATQLGSKKIAIMATTATLKSTDLKNLLNRFGQEKQIFKIQSKGLESAIEQYNLVRIKNILKKSLSVIRDLKIDTIVLGCTHYPLVKKEIRQIVGSKIKIIDSHSAIAKRVNSILKSQNIFSKDKKNEYFFTTGKVLEFSKIASTLLKYNIEAQTAKI